MAPGGRRRTNASLNLFSSSPVLSLVLLPFLLFFLSFPAPTAAAGSAVLGIDVGTEYLKAALVKPGIPLEIVLTKDSKRKESAAVAFKPTRQSDALFPERFYGGDALALSARYPDDVYVNLKSLLGLPFKDGKGEIVEAYHERYPALRLESGPGERGTIGLRSNRLGVEEKKDAFLIEELLAMQLKQIKANADALAGKGSDVRDAVITYPPFYTADEKRSLQLAAELAGLNVDAFISDGLAVGLNYAMSRTFPSVSDGQTPEYHVVYDMGAGSTTATVLRFQSRTVKDVGKFTKTVQEVQVLGSSWDKTLGGDSLNDLLVEDMVAQLVEEKKLKGRVAVADVRTHGKTMARLWKDAEKARQVLSANSDTSASFESLFEEDVNFKYRLSRSKFEELAEQYIVRVGKPLEQALAAAGLQLNDIDSVILHGGAIRTPFVQKELEKVCGGSDKLRTNVNADEAAVFGAAFKGAGLSPSFRVKDIRASDASGYAVVLKWTSESKERQQKLFTPASLVGPEKQVTVKNLEDFEFSFYQQVPTTEDIGGVPVLGVKTLNLTASANKLKESFGCSAANITTKFSIRLNPRDGLPEVSGGSVSCEVEPSMLGSVVEDVKGFFGLGNKKDGQIPLGEDGEPIEPITLEAEEPQKSATSSGDESASTDSAKESKKVASQPRLESIPISLTSSPLGIPGPSPAELTRIQGRLAAFDASDRDRLLREEALNELESFIYRSRDLAEDGEFAKVLTSEQLATLTERVSTASDWLYDDGADAKTAEFKEKLKSLKEIVQPALKRKQENASRPARIQLLQESLKNAQMVISVMEKQIAQDEDIYSSSLAASPSSASETESSASSPSASTLDDLEDDAYASSSTAEPTPSAPATLSYSIFQPSDLTSLSETYEAANTWLESRLAAQEKLSDMDEAALTVAEIDTNLKRLERVMNRIYEKMGAAATRKASNDKPTKKNGKKDKEQAKEKDGKTKEPVKEDPAPEKPAYNKKDEL
ncbi:Hsp70 protein-domain-containing protein [Aspergillus pseudoustus]|uniref:Hsp70 protein-domain-containing protein n=1 Tax=Aspergillus pseudoustus TaxID=1810923 RepID=A0ABR4J0L9_9EURO